MFDFAGFVLDKEDNSVTRSDPYFRELFKKCGLYILSVKVNDQKCQVSYIVSIVHLSYHSSNPTNETGPEGAPEGTICCQNVCAGDKSTKNPE